MPNPGPEKETKKAKKSDHQKLTTTPQVSERLVENEAKKKLFGCKKHNCEPDAKLEILGSMLTSTLVMSSSGEKDE